MATPTKASDPSLTEQLALSTVRIEIGSEDGKLVGTGTGFFFNFLKTPDGLGVPAIVTNKHVVLGAKIGRIFLNRADAQGNRIPGEFEPVLAPDFEKLWIGHPDPDVDLTILPIGQFLDAQLKNGKRFFFVSLDASLIPTEEEASQLTAIEDIVMIGYPDGIWDDKNNQPIARRGITATHPGIDYEGKKEFVIDAACFPGSSGSPIVLLNQGSYPTRQGGLVVGTRIKLLGVLYAGPQHIAVGELRDVPLVNPTRTVSVAAIPNNLGFVIKSNQLLGFNAILKEMVAKNAQGSPH